jgi:dienelactone hydrolase
VAVERIDYHAGSVKGALVRNEKVSGKRPLLPVIPNWRGVNENAIKRAQKIAGDKYVAFGIDRQAPAAISARPAPRGSCGAAARPPVKS